MYALTKKLLAGGVAALVLGTSGVALAHDGGDCGMHRGGWMQGRDHEGMQKHVEQRLDKLKETLALRQDQTPAWNAYRSVLVDQAAKMDKRFTAMRDEAAKADKTKPVPAPERFDRWLEGARERTASLEQVAAATRKFYAGLDAQQKAKFDEHLSMTLGHHHPDGRRHPGGEAPAARPAP